MLDYLKEGTIGLWSIQHEDVSQEESADINLGQMTTGSTRFSKAGRYTELYKECSPGNNASRGSYEFYAGCVMSDTPAELKDLNPWRIRLAQLELPGARVRIHGLGLGVCVKMALDNPNILTVDVVERDQDVIRLVGAQLEALYPLRLSITHGNVFDIHPRFLPHNYYHAVWHDIWWMLSYDNWEEYKFLKRRWGWAAQWQWAWGEETLRADARQAGRPIKVLAERTKSENFTKLNTRN